MGTGEAGGEGSAGDLVVAPCAGEGDRERDWDGQFLPADFGLLGTTGERSRVPTITSASPTVSSTAKFASPAHPIARGSYGMRCTAVHVPLIVHHCAGWPAQPKEAPSRSCTAMSVLQTLRHRISLDPGSLSRSLTCTVQHAVYCRMGGAALSICALPIQCCGLGD